MAGTKRCHPVAKRTELAMLAMGPAYSSGSVVYFWPDSTVREDGVVVVSQQWDIVTLFQTDRGGNCFEQWRVDALENARVRYFCQCNCVRGMYCGSI